MVPGTTNGVGGISLIDVRNPNSPKKLVEGAGDFTKKDGRRATACRDAANETHSRSLDQPDTGKVYVDLVDDMEEQDVDILDITNPPSRSSSPRRTSTVLRRSGAGRRTATPCSATT